MRDLENDAIRQVLLGDRDAYRVLVDAHYGFAFRVAFRITGNSSDAEEVTQEAFLRAYTKLAGFRQDAAFSTWINRIVMNTAINFIEREKHELTRTGQPLGEPGSPQPASRAADPERLMLSNEAASLRHAAMASLTPMERTAFTLRHMEDLPIAEIADALRVPANSAKQAVFRAVSKLRLALAPVAGGAG